MEPIVVEEQCFQASSRHRKHEKRKPKSYSLRAGVPTKQQPAHKTSGHHLLRLAQKQKRRAQCQIRNRNRREKELQQQQHWLYIPPEEEPPWDTEDEIAPEISSLRNCRENWIHIATYSRGILGGCFLMVNIATQEAIMERYKSHGGCETCSWNTLSSEEGMEQRLEFVLSRELDTTCSVKFRHLVRCVDMHARAVLCIDPQMVLRTMQKRNQEYLAVSTLYAMYRFFYVQVAGKSRSSWLSMRSQWSCKAWDRYKIKRLVRVQALYRGWHCRKRYSLFSPHTELGRQFLQLQLKRWTLRDSESSIVLHAMT